MPKNTRYLRTERTKLLNSTDSADLTDDMKLYLSLLFIKELQPEKYAQFEQIIFRMAIWGGAHPKLIAEFWQDAPTTAQICRSLAAIGFSQTQVGKMLGISQASVAYHLRSERSIVPYTNRIMKEIRVQEAEKPKPSLQENERVRW